MAISGTKNGKYQGNKWRSGYQGIGMGNNRKMSGGVEIKKF